jgi:hypothetical protein
MEGKHDGHDGKREGEGERAGEGALGINHVGCIEK